MPPVTECYYKNGVVHCMAITAKELQSQGWTYQGAFRMACDGGKCHMHDAEGEPFSVWVKRDGSNCEVFVGPIAPPNA